MEKRCAKQRVQRKVVVVVMRMMQQRVVDRCVMRCWIDGIAAAAAMVVLLLVLVMQDLNRIPRTTVLPSRRRLPPAAADVPRAHPPMWTDSGRQRDETPCTTVAMTDSPAFVRSATSS